MSALVVQRIRVRWDSRDAAAATVRGRLPREYALPPLPLAVHEVLLDEATGYRPVEQLREGVGAVREAGLWVEWRDGRALVDRLPTRDRDDRVHLYGGPAAPRAARSRK